MKTTAYYFFKSLAIILLPVVFWFFVIATGFGAQSLSQIIEIPIVIVISIAVGYTMWDQKSYRILMVLFLLVFLLRWLMPGIPE